MHRLHIISMLTLVTCLTACQPVDSFENVATPGTTPTAENSPTPSFSLTPTHEKTDVVQVASQTPTETLLPNTATPTPLPVLCSPLADHSITQLIEIISSPYEPPPPGRDERHHGVDFAYYNHASRASIDGEGVQAIMAGRVAAVIHDRLPYGNMVIIETPEELIPPHIFNQIDIPSGSSIYHLYAHFSQTPLAELGQEIECGHLLGYAGQTGYVVPVPHLHLETRIGPAEERFESMVFFDTQATPEEQAAYTRWRTSGDFQHFDPMRLLRSSP